MKPFYFIRHGETDWNRQGISMGSTDIPLNEYGIKQAHEAAKILQKYDFKTIVTSPLKRAYETAQIIASMKKDVEFHIIDDLKEVEWGIQEGKKYNEKVKENWKNGICVEGAEHILDVEQRCIKVLKQVFDLSDPVLMVSHGGVYRAIRKALFLPSINCTPNCVPFHHLPPEEELYPWWRVYEVL